MDAFKIRLIHEEKKLSTRMAKLATFLNSEASTSLSMDDRVDLEQQHGAMDGYLTVLRRRMAKLEILPLEGLTPGQKAAGVNFNPSKDPLVDEIKDQAAELLDTCIISRNAAGQGDKGRYYSKAISYLEDAQMNAVKAATWQH